MNNRELARLLREIEVHDLDYAVRNALVLQALGAASKLGFRCGVRVDPVQPAWPVAFIELNEGQVSWHLEQHSRPWDSHTTVEKYRRVRAFVAHAEGSLWHRSWADGPGAGLDSRAGLEGPDGGTVAPPQEG